MAKVKNKKKKSSEEVHKPKDIKPKLNPFEVHINKEKMKVLGKKSKNDRGLPGISRAKGIQKRKETLLQEYKQKHKSNLFKDRRLGEQNTSLTEEDRATVRFTAVRLKAHKKSIFNLADDEVLTHKGRAISDFDKFDDPRSDDESLDDDQGRLGSEFVGNAHFAGGIFTNTNKDGAKTHKEIIDELIAESKKRKAEKQKAKEATLELTEKLDAEWKDLMPLMAKSSRKAEESIEKPKLDDYDKLAMQLRFEAKVQAGDRLKSEDEIAKEEKEKLEELEQERVNRMKGFVEDSVTKRVHRSADDLDDDFVYDSDVDQDQMLTYNEEGEANVEISAQFKGKQVNIKKSGEEARDKVDEEESEGDAENEDEDGSESNDEAESKDQAESEEDSEEDEENESEDNLSDLKAESSDSDNDEADNTKVVIKAVDSRAEKRKINGNYDEDSSKKRKVSETANPEVLHNDSELESKIKEDLLRRKDMMEKARKELPYTFELPKSYEEFEDLFEKYPPDHQSVIVERMIKCHHPSLAEGNKEKLGKLFTFLLQYLNDISSNAEGKNDVQACFEKFASLVPQLFDLAQFDKERVHNALVEVIREKHEEYKKTPKAYPGLENLIFFKLVSLLFPTSDFRHQVVTPCVVFIDQMLTRCRVKSKRDIAYGLFLTTLILEYTFLSKRYLPAAVNFLSGLLHMAIPKVSIKIIKVIPPFRAMSNDLVLSNRLTGKNFSYKMCAEDLVDGEVDDLFKTRTIYTVLKQLGDFNSNFKPLSSNVEIFEPVLKYLEAIPIEKYPESVQKEFESLLSNLKNNEAERKLYYVAMEVKRPKALRLYEPKIVEVYDGKRHKVQSKEKAQNAKLLHKLKQETKGALREVRRDQAFLSRVKIKQNIESDKERREKVKKLFSEAASQQSELNKMDRAKKRK